MFDLARLDTTSIEKTLANAERKLTSDTGNPLLLFKARLGENGWLLGQEAKIVTGETVILLAGSIMKGWVAFDEDTNKKLGETAEPLFGDNIAQPDKLSSLPNAKVSAQTSAIVRIDSTGTTAEMKGSTVGMEQQMNSVINLIIGRLKNGQKLYLNPRLQLGVDTYSHKQYGRTFTPKLDVLSWHDIEGKTEPTAIESRI